MKLPPSQPKARCFGGQVLRGVSGGVECLAAFEACDRSLKCFKPLVVIALGRRDRRVTEQIADLGKRNVPLDQP